MDMKSLNYFVHAAETLNFTKAAKECYISQTAISLSIAKMEEELGFMLFDRNNRSIRLTPAGRCTATIRPSSPGATSPAARPA